MTLKCIFKAAVIGIIAVVSAGVNYSTFAAPKTLIWVWYPNESTPEKSSSRKAIIEYASKALNRKITEQLTTDYSIAIEALAHGNAAFSWFGAEGYIQANNKEPAVQALLTNSKSESLDNAKYFSMMGIRKDQVDRFVKDGNFNLDVLKQVRFSFVSNTSTSGFRVPSSVIANHFNVDQQDLIEGGKDKVFSEVLFGGSHQLSFLNLIEKRADVAAFANTEVAAYIEFTKGDFNDPKSGDLIRILPNAAAPFTSHAGEEIYIAYSAPVLNGPVVINKKLLKADEIEALKKMFTSQDVLSDKRIFGNMKDPQNPSIFEKGERFVVVDDKWYNPIRQLSGSQLH